MVNFGPRDTVPERYRGRNLYEHNPQATLMRTTAEENARMGRWIGERLNRMDGPVRFFLPEGGVSMLDTPGQAFHDPAADAALFEALEQTVRQTGSRSSCACPFTSMTPPSATRSPPPSRRSRGPERPASKAPGGRQRPESAAAWRATPRPCP